MAIVTFGVKLGTTGPSGVPNGHHGAGVDVTVSYDTTKVMTRRQLNWAVDELKKMVEGSAALAP